MWCRVMFGEDILIYRRRLEKSVITETSVINFEHA